MASKSTAKGEEQSQQQQDQKKKAAAEAERFCCCDWDKCEGYRATFDKQHEINQASGNTSSEHAKQVALYSGNMININLGGLRPEQVIWRKLVLKCMGKSHLEDAYIRGNPNRRIQKQVARHHWSPAQLQYYDTNHKTSLAKPMSKPEALKLAGEYLMEASAITEAGNTVFFQAPNFPESKVAELAKQCKDVDATEIQDRKRKRKRRRLPEELGTVPIIKAPLLVGNAHQSSHVRAGGLSKKKPAPSEMAILKKEPPNWALLDSDYEDDLMDDINNENGIDKNNNKSNKNDTGGGLKQWPMWMPERMLVTVATGLEDDTPLTINLLNTFGRSRKRVHAKRQIFSEDNVYWLPSTYNQNNAEFRKHELAPFFTKACEGLGFGLNMAGYEKKQMSAKFNCKRARSHKKKTEEEQLKALQVQEADTDSNSGSDDDDDDYEDESDVEDQQPEQPYPYGQAFAQQFGNPATADDLLFAAAQSVFGAGGGGFATIPPNAMNNAPLPPPQYPPLQPIARTPKKKKAKKKKRRIVRNKVTKRPIQGEECTCKFAFRVYWDDHRKRWFLPKVQAGTNVHVGHARNYYNELSREQLLEELYQRDARMIRLRSHLYELKKEFRRVATVVTENGSTDY